MLELYKNIKRYRQELRMSQDELAKRAGYTDRSSIAKIEKGLVDLPQSKIRQFAEIFGVAPGDLMGNDGVRTKQMFIELNAKPMIKMQDRVEEDLAPGLLEVRRLYTMFNQQDRDEILSLMRFKAQKYK